jgi:hypothetical protein
MKFGASTGRGNLSQCLRHGVSLAEIEALFTGNVYIVSTRIVSGERRILDFATTARGADFFASSPGEREGSNRKSEVKLRASADRLSPTVTGRHAERRPTRTWQRHLASAR